MTEFLTALLVIVTAFYAWVTFKILRANENVVQEMQKQYLEYIKPSIVANVSTFTSNICLFLRIANVGKSSASNVKLTLDRDFYKMGKRNEINNLRNHPAFSNPIEMFPPGTELLFYLAQSYIVLGDSADQSATPKKFKISIEYSFLNKIYNESVLIDLCPYLYSVTPQNAVVDALGKIEKAIAKG